MKVIWGKLGLVGKKGWDFDKDPCSGEGDWLSSVLCDCSFEFNTTCHVTELIIDYQNISTALPSEFTKLPHLQLLDLSRNYLRGTIPSEWATMRLSTLSLMGNRLSGLFPTALTRMTTLIDLMLRNCFHGPIPDYVKNLRNLKTLDLGFNNLNGEIPSSSSLLEMQSTCL
ncbi:putative LRR receptor-like serine/threonine-protein kinase At1g07650 [Bidens hawaiensis]|uniref:putative LRR receptor-like serine/threonine-protein kinase At1g07650 n=1 Tax=Bidens hawaiensis TaxID=980011 RepID=UPI00404B91B8